MNTDANSSARQTTLDYKAQIADGKIPQLREYGVDICFIQANPARKRRSILIELQVDSHVAAFTLSDFGRFHSLTHLRQHICLSGDLALVRVETAQ